MEKINQANIKILREKMGLSQEEIAKYLGTKREMVSYYETGTREIPLELLEKLAEFFGVDLADLISDNQEVLNANLAFALRSSDEILEKKEIENIASFKKVVLNYLKMKELNK